MSKQTVPKAQGTANAHGNAKASKWKPKPIPKGIKDDHRDAHEIIREWAKYLYLFDKAVFDEVHELQEQIDKLTERVAALEKAGPFLPTEATTHIPDPPPPPFS